MRIAEMIVSRIAVGGEVYETGAVLSLEGQEAALLRRRPELATWNRAPCSLAPGLMIWTPSGRQPGAAGSTGWNPGAALDQGN